MRPLLSKSWSFIMNPNTFWQLFKELTKNVLLCLIVNQEKFWKMVVKLTKIIPEIRSSALWVSFLFCLIKKLSVTYLSALSEIMVRYSTASDLTQNKPQIKWTFLIKLGRQFKQKCKLVSKTNTSIMDKELFLAFQWINISTPLMIREISKKTPTMMF